ncbi:MULTISPECIES: beta-phosphoglucomutase [Atlantibacter]|nr:MULTISPECIES: beta-phosphoglucomutase [Atlantibacter]MCQ4969036.1 beta-phosphoglucomutase [Enterobacteriaceae bacterium DFI.7.85]MDU7389249.1 beta-phosphoglucomutase [Atlantibacter hermannii]
MMLKALIFDLDGVITDTAHLHFLAWKSVAAELGIAIDERMNHALKGISRMASLERILQFGGKATTFSETQKIVIATRKNERYVALLSSLGPDAILPGIAPLLAELKKRGIKAGLASASLNAPRILASLNLLDAFDFCADASRITHPKPHPEIFLAACTGLGVVPEECIGVEDAQAGIDAINACGMLSIGIGASLNNAGLLLSSTEELTWPRIAGLLDYTDKATAVNR